MSQNSSSGFEGDKECMPAAFYQRFSLGDSVSILNDHTSVLSPV